MRLSLSVVEGLVFLGLLTAGCNYTPPPGLTEESDPKQLELVTTGKKLMTEKRYVEAEKTFRAAIDFKPKATLADEARRMYTLAHQSVRQTAEDTAQAKMTATMALHLSQLLADPQRYQGRSVRVTGVLRPNSVDRKGTQTFLVDEDGRTVDAKAKKGTAVLKKVLSRAGSRMTVTGLVVPQDNGISSPFYILIDKAE